MSEELDLEANNLCIPEDAFEKFQAVSMYQEKEYIALPQNEPPKPKPPASVKSCRVSSANEVVSSSGNVMISPVNSTQIESLEEQPLNSSRVESSVGSKKRSKVTGSVHKSRRNSKRNSKYENDTDMVVSNSENVKDEPNTTLALPTPTPNVVARKRGRRSKKPSAPVEELSPETPKTIQNPDISSTPFSSEPENSETVQGARKKRGRPKRAGLNEDLGMVPPNSDKNLSSDLSSSDNNKTADLSTTKPSPAVSRRGRPKGSAKKIPFDVSLSPIIQAQPPPIQEQIKDICKDATDVQHEPINSISNETPKIPKIKQKRSTPKKATSSTVKKVACSTVKKVASSTVKKAESSTVKKSESSPVKKVQSSPVKKVESSPIKKEELSPVKKVETSVVNSENIDLDENKVQPDSNNKVVSDNISDDDMDDVCLSKLKSTPCQSNIGISTEEICPLDNKTDETIKDVNSASIDEQLNKTKKKKGRPKKSVIPPNTPMTDLAPISMPVKVTSGDSDADDVSLSKLKTINEEPPMNTEGNDNMAVPTNDTQLNEQVDEPNEINGTPTKRNTKMPVMADFEYNIDSVIGNDNTEVKDMEEDLPTDPSKRPIRRKAKNMKYQEESDEDPFANVELSDDDEPRRGRRGYKYYSDDEYFPGKRGHAIESTDTELSDNKEIITDDSKKHKRKKFRKKSDNQSPRKRGKKDDDSRSDVASLEAKSKADDTDDFEVCLEPAVIKAKKSKPSQKWGTTTEFENFLAKKIQGTNLKIKKVSNVPAETVKIEIPVIDPDAKKTIEMCSQTTPVSTASVSVQTSTPNDVPLIENIPLTPEQSEKACYFLNSIVKTTAELGSLMTQKSEDFIKKKINTTHVVDTAKMDYCVKKSFLLFKLAKHNLLQMEEDLAKQYDEFLETHNLSRCREQPKAVLPSVKESNSDSDCEIVDVEPSPSKPSQKPQAKPAFNPKTVFLNKELSIKIAKKPSEGKKLDIKGRHTVWINDTVMVKKVPKSSQSFLAQDSRNKKPPDNFITNKMVSDFFKGYYRQKALSACAPFISTDWLTVSKECVCNYFVVKPLQFETNANYSDHDGFSMNSNSSNTTVSEPSHSLTDVLTFAKNTVVSSPEPLFTLCFRILKHHLHHDDFKEGTDKKRHELADRKRNPVTLFRLCMRTIIDCTTNKMEICPAPAKHESSSSTIQVTAPALKVLCYRRIMDLLEDSSFNNTRGEKESYLDINCNSGESGDIWSSNSEEIVLLSENKKNGIKSLFSLCVEYIQRTHIVERNNNSILSPKTLKNIAYENVKYLLYSNDLCETHEDTAVEGLMINCVNTLSEEAFLNLEQYNTDIPDSSEYLDDFDNEDSFEPDVPGADDDDQTEPSWVAQVQMQELRSCVNINNLEALEQQELEHTNEQEELEHADEQEELGLPIGQEELDHAMEQEELEHSMGLEVLEHPMGQELLELGMEQEELGHPMGQDELEHANVQQELQHAIEQDELEHANEQQELEHASEQQELEHANEQQELEPIITQIKLEPLDDITDNLLDSTQVKTEPGPGPDEMTIIPPDVKPEIEDHIHAAPIERHNSNSYDMDTFEQFVSSNKLMRPFTDRDMEESIYSQKSARVRQQHVPDYYSENDVDMLGLLVPHTYEPMNIQTAQTAKGSLMESSSDEGYKKANMSKKGTAKRSRGRQRKVEQRPNNKEVPAPSTAVTKEKEKSTNNEVAILTRKMKERIRQEEKNNESSDSEDENVNLRLRSRDKKDKQDYTKDKLKAGSKDVIDQANDKSKKYSKETSDDEVRYKLNPALMEICDQSQEKSKPGAKEIDDQIPKATTYKTREKAKQAIPDTIEQTPETSTSSSKNKNNEIQCNNVDSTDQLEESVETFTGFTSIETNEMSNYEKYMKFVYEKVIPGKENELVNDYKEARPKDTNNEAPVICPNEPVELLECEPTMPFFDDNTEIEKSPKKIKTKKIQVAKPSFTDRHGWQCYPINLEDTKLCQDAIIYLEKLPESFVQTYFEYQNISSAVDESDQEINR